MHSSKLTGLIVAMMCSCPWPAAAAQDELERNFAVPPDSAKPSVYWWWLYNRVDRAGITRDLEAFKAQGIHGVNLICTGGYAGAEPLPGVEFLGDEWRALFRHAVREAARLDLELGFNLAGGWVMIGPWVTPDHAMKKLVQSEIVVRGPRQLAQQLPPPEVVDGYYHDVWVQAFPQQAGKPLDPQAAIDLTDQLQPNGQLEWDVPAGEWLILRTGYTLTGSRWDYYPKGDTFKGGEGYQIDYLSTAALDDHFNHLGTLVLDEAQKAGGRLAYLWSDSWECGKLTWTQDFPEQFQRFRGYDLKAYLPALAGHTVVNAEVSARFRADFDRTIQDCVAENFYGHFAELCHQHGVEMRNEAAGPNNLPPMDSLKNLGRCDVPAGEFWVNGYAQYPGGYNLNLKQTASAAHTYGLRRAQAEAFTQQEPHKTHWYYGPADMKPFGDSAFCEGINVFMLHEATCQPPADGKPGYEFCAGQHWTPNITWWDQSAPFFAYLARCQYLLQQGWFVGDVCYYLGEQPPIVAPPKHDDPALGRGYDCDYCNAEVLLNRMSVKDGRIVLPDGMSYRLLVLQNCTTTSPDIARRMGGELGLTITSAPSTGMSVEVARKIRELVRAGATVLGPPPESAAGLKDYPACDQEVKSIASEVWGDCDGRTRTEHRFGQGRVIWGQTPHEVLRAGGVPPDFTYAAQDVSTPRAAWIWHAPDGNDPPAGERRFQLEITIPQHRELVSANVGLTADNAFQLQVNGAQAIRGDNWAQLYFADLKPMLRPGTNTLLIRATNSAPGPAGLLVAGRVEFDNGDVLTLDSRREHWLSSTDGDSWQPVREVSEYGAAPWGDIGAYAAPLDFIHRTTGDAEIYFVANRTAQTQAHTCSFRVTDRQPEIWDPLTGRHRAAPAFAQTEGRTQVPLEFAPHGSMFVVFRRPVTAQRLAEPPVNFPARVPVRLLSGPWTVHFDPAWGGPASVEFPELSSWTARPEPGIKYYSGKATYCQTFDLPAQEYTPGTGRLYLDLGNVRHVAQVRLNGRDLGILWTAPWRVDITAAVKPLGNQLEIDAINLWVNRVVGDLNLPKEQRLTRTHDVFRFNMTAKDTPLVESGLLGPVMLLRE